MWPNLLETADLVVFTEEMFNWKIQFKKKLRSAALSIVLNWHILQKII